MRIFGSTVLYIGCGLLFAGVLVAGSGAHAQTCESLFAADSSSSSVTERFTQVLSAFGLGGESGILEKEVWGKEEMSLGFRVPGTETVVVGVYGLIAAPPSGQPLFVLRKIEKRDGFSAGKKLFDDPIKATGEFKREVEADPVVASVRDQLQPVVASDVTALLRSSFPWLEFIEPSELVSLRLPNVDSSVSSITLSQLKKIGQKRRLLAWIKSRASRYVTKAILSGVAFSALAMYHSVQEDETKESLAEQVSTQLFLEVKSVVKPSRPFPVDEETRLFKAIAAATSNKEFKHRRSMKFSPAAIDVVGGGDDTVTCWIRNKVTGATHLVALSAINLDRSGDEPVVSVQTAIEIDRSSFPALTRILDQRFDAEVSNRNSLRR